MARLSSRSFGASGETHRVIGLWAHEPGLERRALLGVDRHSIRAEQEPGAPVHAWYRRHLAGEILDLHQANGRQDAVGPSRGDSSRSHYSAAPTPFRLRRKEASEKIETAAA